MTLLDGPTQPARATTLNGISATASARLHQRDCISATDGRPRGSIEAEEGPTNAP
jgi:hypothetical protein